jgi:hypothetical protein
VNNPLQAPTCDLLADMGVRNLTKLLSGGFEGVPALHWAKESIDSSAPGQEEGEEGEVCSVV